MQASSASVTPFTWSQDNIMSHAPKFLEQQLDRFRVIVDLAKHEIAGISFFSVLNGRIIKEQTREFRSNVKKFRDKAEEILSSLEPTSNEYERLSKIANQASDQLALAKHLTGIVLRTEKEIQTNFKPLKIAFIGSTISGIGAAFALAASRSPLGNTAKIALAAMSIISWCSLTYGMIIERSYELRIQRLQDDTVEYKKYLFMQNNTGTPKNAAEIPDKKMIEEMKALNCLRDENRKIREELRKKIESIKSPPS